MSGVCLQDGCDAVMEPHALLQRPGEGHVSRVNFESQKHGCMGEVSPPFVFVDTGWSIHPCIATREAKH